MLISGHLNDDVLERYAMRRLSEAESDAVEDHIAFCGHCLDRLDHTTAFVAGMTTALRDNEGEERRRIGFPVKKPTWMQRWLAVPVWAGAALAAAGVFFVVLRPGALPPAALVTLDGTRGASTVVHGSGPFDFELFMPTEAQSFHVELLDAGGATRWQSDVSGANGKLHAVVKQRVSAGQYYLHVTEPVSHSQHDFAVTVQK